MTYCCLVVPYDFNGVAETAEDILEHSGDQVGVLTVQSIGLLHSSQLTLALGCLQQGKRDDDAVFFVQLSRSKLILAKIIAEYLHPIIG